MKRLVLAVAVTAVTVAGVLVPRIGSGEEDEGSAVKQRTELPRGGTSVLPENRVVAFYGAPQAPQLGTLGIGGPKAAGRRLQRRARSFARRGSRPVLPAFELISTIVQSAPGKDGEYRHRQPAQVISRYLDAARRIHGLLLLDIQPGRADFPTEAKALEPWLRRPEVGIALDPEWRMKSDEVPGEVIGQVRASEVNQVIESVSRIVAAEHLPDKLMVIHQFTPEMISDRNSLRPRRGVDLVLDADGFGTPPDKRQKYRQLAPPAGGPFFRGFKLFYAEDTGLMSPRQVLRLDPGPVDFVVYE
ncbi:MAG: hypothetical protein ABR536_03375 [Solirubrobacterales bacterium]